MACARGPGHFLTAAASTLDEAGFYRGLALSSKPAVEWSTVRGHWCGLRLWRSKRGGGRLVVLVVRAAAAAHTHPVDLPCVECREKQWTEKGCMLSGRDT